MEIDKSWTSLGKHEKALYTGHKKFVDDCKPLVDSVGNIRCPCKSCRLVLWVSIKHLSDHISKYGFDPSYKTWIHHGEADLPPPPPVIDNIRQPQMSDTTACLNELSYIRQNNEQNEPTEGDIGKTSNDPTQAKRNEFEELYSSANEELYPGCDYVTRLDFMAKVTYFKANGKLTDSIFNEMLEFFQNVFPTAKGYKLPPSYYEIKKTFNMIGLGYESIHACVNDCFLFQGDANKDVHFCPVCNTSRWKHSNTPGKKVPKKVLRYFLIISRLQRLYKSSHTAKEMTWHATGKCTEPGKIQHPVDGKAWKDFDTKYLDFAEEPRKVRLGLAADGFNPFGNLSRSYSMWPMILTTYNLPSWLCIKESYFMLTLLIPGPKSSGKDIDVYLRPLIDDLKTINDFPARSSLSGWRGQGYKACPTCNEDTPYVHVLGKTAYVGHKRFLKKPHKWRRSLEFNGETKNVDPLREFSQDAIMTQLARLPTHVKGKHLRYMKKLKNYVRNKAKPDGSIAKGYVAEEALTFSSHYFHDVTTKFNCLDRNVDCPHPTCQFQVFKSLCKSIGLRSVIRINHKELKKVIWYVLHNSPEIDTYRAKFKIEFPNKDMIEEFSADNDPGVNESSELFALACGPSQTPISVNSYVVNDVRFVVHSCDERRTTQNSGICSPGPGGEMYYGQLEQILEFSNLSFKTVLFRVK
nr:hypothetical protein [Tanacetum cinerariifolium]